MPDSRPRFTSAEVAGEELRLLPERAVYWPARATLFVADMHVGKAAAFRAGGVPIPSGSTDEDLDRLTDLLLRTRASRLVILGDLYHARAGMVPATIEQLQRWREGHPDVEVDVVLGNHDRRAGPSPGDLRFREHDEPLMEPPFVFRHDPVRTEGGYVLSGHLHPAAKLRGRGVRSMRLPCFFFGEHVGILPAFGTFTGTAVVRPKRGERVFVVAGSEVLGVCG